MKKANRKITDDLRPEYDFANMKGGVRGRYAAQTRSRTNLVLLGPEIAKAFPTDASVNQVLRVVLDLTSRMPSKIPLRPRSSKREKTAKAGRGQV
jgi:hypothetical protein